MTTYLPDVNVLVALLSSKHAHHTRAAKWFESVGHTSWLTCPITQNGAVRVMSGPRFSKVSVTAGSMIDSVRSLIHIGKHEFIPDDISLIENALINPSHLLGAQQLTDTYLLALAVQNDAILATLDRHIVAQAVRNGVDHLLLLP